MFCYKVSLYESVSIKVVFHSLAYLSVQKVVGGGPPLKGKFSS